MVGWVERASPTKIREQPMVELLQLALPYLNSNHLESA